MHAITHHWLTLLLVLMLLASCGVPSMGIAPSPTTSSTPLTSEVEQPLATTQIATQIIMTPTATQTLAATAITQQSSLPDGWYRVEWQSLSIPLPPEAMNFIPSSTTATDQIHTIPVLAAGSVAFPPSPPPTNGAIGEYPAPPSLTLLQFSGTLDEWIALEEEELAIEEGGVIEPVELLTVAGREARHYQRTVPGFNYNDYYVLKPTETTLLLIYTNKEAYHPLVDGLTFVKP